MNLTIIDDQSSSSDEDDKEATIESPTLSEEDFNQRRSVQMKKYSNSISEEWDMSREKIRNSLHLSPETDLTGPDYCQASKEVNSRPDTSNSICEKTSDEPAPVGTVKKKTPQRQTSINSAPPKTPTKTTKKETAIFYTRVDTDQTSVVSGDQPWKLEDLEVPDETGSNPTTDQVIKGPPSPTDTQKPKLWSCFPAIKSGSKRNSYKMVTQSPPYMPVSRENTSR